MVVALQTMVTRGFDVFDPAWSRSAGSTPARRTTSSRTTAEFEATMRSFSATRHEVQRDDRAPLRGHRRGARPEVEVDYRLGYPVTVNDATEYDRVVAAVRDLFGADRYTLMTDPELGSEDMSFVLQRVPGAYLNLSACANADHDAAPTTTRRGRPSTTRCSPTRPWLAEMALRRCRAG